MTVGEASGGKDNEGRINEDTIVMERCVKS
jgi:hypothetical protein